MYAFLQRDYMRKTVGGAHKPTDAMSEVMTPSPVEASPSHSVVQALAILAEGKCVGVVMLQDVSYVRALSHL